MAKKATKTVEKKEDRSTKIPKSVSKHIRLLKSQGRTEEAENLRKTTVENRKSE